MGRSVRTQDEFRAWLENNHATENELIVRCYKVRAKDRAIGYRESLDEAPLLWLDRRRAARARRGQLHRLAELIERAAKRVPVGVLNRPEATRRTKG